MGGKREKAILFHEFFQISQFLLDIVLIDSIFKNREGGYMFPRKTVVSLIFVVLLVSGLYGQWSEPQWIWSNSITAAIFTHSGELWVVGYSLDEEGYSDSLKIGILREGEPIEIINTEYSMYDDWFRADIVNGKKRILESRDNKVWLAANYDWRPSSLGVLMLGYSDSLIRLDSMSEPDYQFTLVEDGDRYLWGAIWQKLTYYDSYSHITLHFSKYDNDRGRWSESRVVDPCLPEREVYDIYLDSYFKGDSMIFLLFGRLEGEVSVHDTMPRPGCLYPITVYKTEYDPLRNEFSLPESLFHFTYHSWVRLYPHYLGIHFAFNISSEDTIWYSLAAIPPPSWLMQNLPLYFIRYTEGRNEYFYFSEDSIFDVMASCWSNQYGDMLFTWYAHRDQCYARYYDGLNWGTLEEFLPNNLYSSWDGVFTDTEGRFCITVNLDSLSGIVCRSGTTGIVGEEIHPKKMSLICFPNPFNSEINFSLKGVNKGELNIYNLLGEKVRSFNIEPQSGDQLIRWDGKDSYDTACPSGVYLVIFESEERKACSKALLLR